MGADCYEVTITALIIEILELRTALKRFQYVPSLGRAKALRYIEDDAYFVAQGFSLASRQG